MRINDGFASQFPGLESADSFDEMPTAIESRQMTFGEILKGDRTYSVPPYQRDYSWTENEVEQLWSDIAETIDEGRNEHFMGAIVVNASKKPLELIDGQQRLATISVLLCVIRNLFQESNDQIRASTIADQYLGSLQLRTTSRQPKITLNEKNNPVYKDRLIEARPFEEIQSLSRSRQVDRSNRLLLETYVFLYKKVKERIEAVQDVTETLVQLEECISERLIAILISVSDEANAYLIFETLNDRGLDLSVADLLKNYFFSRAMGRLDEIKTNWSQMNVILHGIELKRYIRHYWVSHNGTIRERDLYRAVVKSASGTNLSATLVKQLRDSAVVYAAFEEPSSIVWEGYGSDVRDDLRYLMLFRVTQCYPVLLAAKEVLNREMFSRVLRMLLTYSFRYNVICGFSAGNLERAYGNVSVFIRKERPRSIKRIFEQIDELYPDDDIFESYFSTKTITNPALARYILSSIENWRRQNREFVVNRDESELTLEVRPKASHYATAFGLSGGYGPMSHCQGMSMSATTGTIRANS